MTYISLDVCSSLRKEKPPDTNTKPARTTRTAATTRSVILSQRKFIIECTIRAFGVENTNHEREVVMRVNFIGSCGLVVAVSMSASLHFAQAGDRRDSAGIGDRSDRRVSDFVTTSSSPRHGGIAALWVTNSDSKFSRSRSERTPTKEKESAPTPAKERKMILFRFDPKFGDISVQPVLGQINGAQICVGF